MMYLIATVIFVTLILTGCGTVKKVNPFDRGMTEIEKSKGDLSRGNCNSRNEQKGKEDVCSRNSGLIDSFPIAKPYSDDHCRDSYVVTEK